MKKIYLLTTLLLLAGMTMAQNAYTGLHKYDGEHKNEIYGYFMGGYNVVSDGFGGLEVSYKRHLTDRWYVGTDAQVQVGKQLYSIDVQGGYRLPVKWMDFLLNQFKEWDANIVFCGHVHKWDYQEVGGVHYLTLDSMCEENNPNPGDYLVRVHVKADGSISWERVRMNYTKK